ncbi:MAG: TonB-dependent receptor [Acidobacteria bacterium]|nr:TonB-dependent receptor [Acidobacteriota bacterium]
MTTDHRAVTTPLAVLLVALLAAPLFAQSTATIVGVVRDSGGVLPGATVTVRNVDTGLTRSVPTGADGAFRFPALPVGPYEIRAELSGFRTMVRSGVRLQVGQEAVIDVMLELGSIQETVTVTGQAPLVETTTSALGAVVTAEEIASLPLEGRNYIGLTMMQPGVSESRTISASAYPGIWFSSSGAPPRSNGYSLDGADIRNGTGVTTSSVTGQTLGLDGIQEYKVLTNAFPAEYGGVMGSQTVMVSKAGTNQFHGSVFQYHRDRNLEAANYFDDPDERTQFSRNNYGGSFGGPLRQNRLFVHGTVEYARVRRGTTNIANTLPAAAHVDGGLVPRIHPAIKPLVDLYPSPNAPGNRYTFVFTEPASDLYGQVRLDANMSASSTLFGRYTVTNGDTTAATFFPGYETHAETRSRFLTLSENHIFGPTVVSTTRVSYSRPDAHYTADYPSQLLSDPRYNFLPGEAMGIVSVGGVTDIGPSANFPRAFAGKDYTASNDTNVSAGRSSWKFGVRVNRAEQFVQQAFSRGGQASFANVTTFLQGLPNFTRAPSPGSSNSKTLTFTSVGVYAQDDLKVSDRLTLNLGVRYEPQTRYKEKFGRESAIRNILTDAEATLGPLFKNNTLDNVSPRLGFAWDVGGNGKTAVRGAAARLYDLGNLATPLVQAVAGTPPFSSLSRVNNAPFTVPFELPSEGSPQALRIIDYNLAAPNMWHYNVAVERELVANMALTVAYAGSRGVNLIRTAEGNPRMPSQTLADGRPFWTGQEPRVSPYWNTIELKVADSKSRYDSLQVRLNQRLSRGLQFQNSLTWASAKDNYSGFSNTDFGGAEGQTSDNPFDRGHDWAPMPTDVRLSYRGNLVYRIPDAFAPGSVAGALFNTWQVATIVQATSGQPFTPGLTTNRSRSGQLGGQAGNDRPDLIPGVKPADVTKGVSRGCGNIKAGTPVGTADLWFDPCAFTIPALGTLGNAPRNGFTLPGYSRVDLSFMKMIPFGSSVRTELRVDVFNVLNRVNLGLPNRIVYGAQANVENPLVTAGLITTADAARQAQISVRVSF